MIVCLNFMGEDFVCDVGYRVTSYGCDAQTYGPAENCYPAEPPEWEIKSIVLYRDVPATYRLPEARGFEATGALFDCLADLPAINDAICQEICESGPGEPDYDDRDF